MNPITIYDNQITSQYPLNTSNILGGYDMEHLFSMMSEPLKYQAVDLRILFDLYINIHYPTQHSADYYWTPREGFNEVDGISSKEMHLGIVKPLYLLDILSIEALNKAVRSPCSLFPYYQILLETLLPQTGLDLNDLIAMTSWTQRCGIMRSTGIPLDVERIQNLQEQADTIERDEKASINLYNESGRFDYDKWDDYIAAYDSNWPVVKGHYSRCSKVIDENRCKSNAEHPIERYYQHTKVLRSLKTIRNLDHSGFQHPFYCPWQTTTSRNATKTSNFIPGCAKQFRNIIKAPVGYSIWEFDYSGQEWLISAKLSGDVKMLDLYTNSLDIYSTLQEALDLPTRDKAKLSGISILYGIGKKTLSKKLDWSEEKTEALINRFNKTFSTYHQYTQSLMREQSKGNCLVLKSGWALGANCKSPASYVNFLTQGEGAEILRKCVQAIQDAGITVIYTVHDSVAVMVPENDEKSLDLVERIMIDSAYPEIRIKRKKV